jgi:hypothetical protein
MRNRPSREPALDWRCPRQPPICEELFWTRLGTNVFLGWLRSPGLATSSLASRLIPMGVWCDFGRNRRTEKTGAIYASNIVAARMNLPQRRDWTLLRKSLTLDFGRLMGVGLVSPAAGTGSVRPRVAHAVGQHRPSRSNVRAHSPFPVANRIPST